MLGSIIEKDYCPNVNYKEIQVYGNINECIESKKQLCLVKNIKNKRENKNKVKSTGKNLKIS